MFFFLTVVQAIVAAAKSRGLTLPVPSEVAEIPGEGVLGHVEGRPVIVGGEAFVASRIGGRPGDHAAIAAGSALGRYATADEIAAHARYLLTDAPAYLNGSVQVVDGCRR